MSPQDMVLILRNSDTVSSTISQVRTRGASHAPRSSIQHKFTRRQKQVRTNASKNASWGIKEKLLFLHAIS